MSDNVSGPDGPKRAVVVPGYMRVSGFCGWSGLSAPTVHRLCRRGLLRKIRIGGGGSAQ
jgi:hypothetical protein